MKAIYPDDGAGDPDNRPAAVPGLRPGTEGAADVPSRTLEVDGEIFVLRPNEFGGTDYTWLNGPDPGYGFGVSPAAEPSLDEHRANIRRFLADIDPTTGHLHDGPAG